MSDRGTAIARRKGWIERAITRVLTFAMFLLTGFAVLRYLIGASHTLAWSLAYIDAVVSTGVVELRERIVDAR